MDMKDVFIAEFDQHKAITYPEVETKGSLSRQPCDLAHEDYNFNHSIPKHTGFRIHHIETLQPVIYYLRFLVDKEGKHTEHSVEITRYVVSARINLNNFGHSDLLELIDKAIDSIRKL